MHSYTCICVYNSLQASLSKANGNSDKQHSCHRAESGRAGLAGLARLTETHIPHREARCVPARLSRVKVWRPATMLW